jgi:hypothetical protein
MKRLVAAGIIILALGAWPAALARADSNPNGTGQPSQTCLSSTAPTEPGQAASSPGSPFNEVNGIAGGVYAGNSPQTTPPQAGGTFPGQGNPVSQYDVACYQVSH